MVVEGSTESLIVYRRYAQIRVSGEDGRLHISCREETLERHAFVVDAADVVKSMTIVRLWLAGVNGQEIHRALALGIGAVVQQ